MSKLTSFHKTCPNRYDRHHLQRKLEKLKTFMRLQKMRTAWLTRPNQDTLKNAVQQDTLIQLKIIVYSAKKKTQREI